MVTELDIEKLKSVLQYLALGAMWQLIFFVSLSLVCLNAKKILSQRYRFFIALGSGYFFMLCNLLMGSTSGHRYVFHYYYFNAVTVACILGFMLICYRLRSAEEIRKDHKFLMYLLMLYAVGYLIFYYTKLLKWYF